MTSKLKLKIIVDISMTVSLIILMAYMLTGDLAHEIIGTLLIALWIVHTVLNRKWYKSLAVPPYHLRRSVNNIINILLLLSAIGLVVSSIMLSSYVFSFLNIDGGMDFARKLHMVTSYWGFVLSSLHLGMHWSRVIKITAKSTKSGISVRVRVLLNVLAVLMSGFGIYAFIKNQIASYMFLRIQFVFFDFEQPVLYFFFEYISMVILFASVTFYFTRLLGQLKIRRQINA